MKFYLGTHMTHWVREYDIPFFISRQRLKLKKTLPRVRGSWALDSGAFSELSLRGTWTLDPANYVHEVETYTIRMGQPDFVCTQDWMCEPIMLDRTGLTVREHQERTVQNYLDLKSMAPTIPWLPTLQGYTEPEYYFCWDLYTRAGIDLRAAPRIGLGSICRRQSTPEIESLVRRLSGDGLQLHGFGVKKLGLAKIGHLLASADSMAWSMAARRDPPLPGCMTHKNCANCPRYALRWYDEILALIPTPERRRT